MSGWRDAGEVLDYAIRRETEAAAFYRALADAAVAPGMDEVFRGFAVEEEGHRARLEALRASGGWETPVGRPLVLTAESDRLAPPDIDTPDLNYREVLEFAVACEEEAESLYRRFAETAPDPSIRATLSDLARDEAAHAEKFRRELAALQG